MKFAIADPPYLGRAHRWYGIGGRAKGRGKGKQMVDYLICPAPRKGFPGSKPMAWTIWVLDAMGVKQGDKVEDLFNGSGMVTAAIESYLSNE
jgi:hypothetical protein